MNPAPRLVVKENISVEGRPFECGSATRAGVVGTITASCVSAALDAGFELSGMAACDEFAYGCTGELNAGAALENPIAPGRMVGGSSSGCAVAVASGLADAGIGTDTAGSARIPAALCGVFGFKPAYDSIARDGVFPLSTSLDHIGVLGSSLELVTRLARALLCPAGIPSTSAVTIVRPRDLLAEVMDDEVRSVWRRIVAALDLAPVGDLPGWHQAQNEGATVQAYEAWLVHRSTVARSAELINGDVLRRLQSASRVPAGEYARAVRAMAFCREHAVERLGPADVVALPTVPVAPPRRGRLVVGLERRSVPVRQALLQNTRFANYSGLPALSVPVWAGDGVFPIGLQLVGRTNAAVLEAGRQAVERLDASGLRTSANPPSVSPGRRAVPAILQGR